ncbi:MAG TPA: helical backbone metal receptor [Flavipsychrobacter sp.]|nr:helical backbone metal receptor [Flavipsychrobacter sp.]
MKQSFRDMMDRDISIKFPPQRIVSVVPSQTELLYDLGLDEQVIGITKFCVHPQEWFRAKTRVGGTKNLNVEMVLSLQPDLVIANKEENTREQIEYLAQYIPTWISDIQTVDDGLSMIERVGALTGRVHQASTMLERIKNGFSGIAQMTSKTAKQKAAYFIWRRPWMSVGRDTFIHDVLQRCGFENVFAGEKRYPEIDDDMLKRAEPDVVLLSSEPYPFKDNHVLEIRKLLPNATIKLVDGEMFSWYGSRMVKAVDYLKTFIQEGS